MGFGGFAATTTLHRNTKGWDKFGLQLPVYVEAQFNRKCGDESTLSAYARTMSSISNTLLMWL